MTTEPRKAKEIFVELVGKVSPAKWDEQLQQTCKGDDELLGRVRALLCAHAAPGSFLEQPAIANDEALNEMQFISEHPGTVIGPYKLMEQIGEGGFGLVFVAEQHQPVRRKVAVKLIKPGMDTRDVIARFEAERQALALMDHPNIAHVCDAGATNSGRPYFVMELVHGIPITDFCDQQCLAQRERLELFVSLCHAIQHAHQKGIIHRDVKPTNVLVTLHDGRPVVKVIDFGVAKALSQQLTERTIYTQFAQMIGTPLYMSPEQAAMSGLDIDTRSDIYSLGVLLYELLTGATPFDRERLHRATTDEIRRIIREDEPLKPSTRVSTHKGELLSTVADQRKIDPRKFSQSLRGDLDWIVMKCLEKDRNRRYETASGLAMDVQRHLDNEPVVARSPTNVYRFQKMVRRNKLAFIAASAVLAALVLGLGTSTWMFVKEKAARERAVAAEQEQVHLRRQAETARANETRLRKQAQAEEQKAKTEAAKSEQMAAYMTNLAQVLARGDLYEAEQIVSELLTPQLESDPQSAGWLRFRGDLWARTGRWKEAAADFSKLIELEPENHENYHMLAPLLVQSGDLDAYRRHCVNVVERFGKINDPAIAERMAKDCLILPSSGADLDAVDDMIDSALAAGPDYWAATFFQFAKGLSEYRQGHFTSAVEWVQNALAKPGESEFRDAQAYLVLAMAHHQLNQVEEARAAFAEGSAIIETRQPILGSGARGADWNDWLIAHALQREATALIEGPSSAAPQAPQ